MWFRVNKLPIYLQHQIYGPIPDFQMFSCIFEQSETKFSFASASFIFSALIRNNELTCFLFYFKDHTCLQFLSSSM